MVQNLLLYLVIPVVVGIVLLAIEYRTSWFQRHVFRLGNKARRARHVVCTQWRPPYTHLSMSETARKCTKTLYVGSTDRYPVPIDTLIDTLSLVVIGIKNDSDTHALRDIRLKFRVPNARVLNVWWEDPPQFKGQLAFHCLPNSNASTQTEKTTNLAWQVEVSLPELKSYELYGESCSIAILADGILDIIEMPPQGSGPQVSQEQVWTPRFISPDEAREHILGQQVRRVQLRYCLWVLVLFLALIPVFWITFLALCDTLPDIGIRLWFSLFLYFILGFIVSAGSGYTAQRALLSIDHARGPWLGPD